MNFVARAPTETATRSVFSARFLNTGATTETTDPTTVLIVLKTSFTTSFNPLRLCAIVPMPADCKALSTEFIILESPVTIAVFIFCIDVPMPSDAVSALSANETKLLSTVESP